MDLAGQAAFLLRQAEQVRAFAHFADTRRLAAAAGEQDAALARTA